MAASDWQTAQPEAVGLDAAVLHGLDDHLKSLDGANIHSLLVVRRGSLAFERYFGGEDEIWGKSVGRVEFDRETKHDLRSITKSVTSLLLGVAVARRLIDGIDRALFDFFPEYAELRTPDNGHVTLRHLLTMSPGFAWNEYVPYTDPANSEMRLIRSPDRYRFALEQPIETRPGQFFKYNSGASELLGAVVRKAAGVRLEDFAREALFEPLDITDVEWSNYPNSEIVSSSGGLRLRPRDLAKLGQLVLTNGRWGERQIVSAEWIEVSTTPQIGHPDGLLFYGYQWWLGRSLLDRREVAWTAAMGLGGQRLFIVPRLDLVVAITAGLYASALQYWLPTQILNRIVLAAVRN
jgi:CubicO group peptidase (beta-lactamase class C family)